MSWKLSGSVLPDASRASRQAAGDVAAACLRDASDFMDAFASFSAMISVAIVCEFREGVEYVRREGERRAGGSWARANPDSTRELVSAAI